MITNSNKSCTLNGWTFEIDQTNATSWVFKNIKNDSYTFAQEITIEKIVILMVDDIGKNPKSIVLTDKDFTVLPKRNPKGMPATEISNSDLANFAPYFSKYKVRGYPLALQSNKSTIKGDLIGLPLFIIIEFMFGEYGFNPPHEFTGSLKAARFNPAIRFETRNKNISSVRVHIRFHFDVDSYLVTDNPIFKLIETKEDKYFGKENYASIIRDADYFPKSFYSFCEVFQLIKKYFKDQDKMSQLLQRVEVPSQVPGTGIFVTNIKNRDTSLIISLSYGVYGFTTKDITVSDSKVRKLNFSSFDAFEVENINTLTSLIITKIKAENIPNISINSYLENNIKYCLLDCAFEDYNNREGQKIKKQFINVCNNFIKDFQKVLEDLEYSLAEDIGYISAGLIVRATLGSNKVLEDSLSNLAGKILSVVGFDGVEKPIPYEVAGLFVKNGTVSKTWDNLHWWGTDAVPSAPGAFFAIHSHFRWTQLNTYPSLTETKFLKMLNLIIGSKKDDLHLGTAQLRSAIKKFASCNLSGPLVDPNIPNQTVSFIITENGSDLDKSLKDKDGSASFEAWSNKNKKPNSKKISSIIPNIKNKGAEIVYWLSCEATRELNKEFRGTMFINGFYFAHDEERPFRFFAPSNMFSITQGVSIQKPHRSDYKLFRTPFDKM